MHSNFADEPTIYLDFLDIIHHVADSIFIAENVNENIAVFDARLMKFPAESSGLSETAKNRTC